MSCKSTLTIIVIAFVTASTTACAQQTSERILRADVQFQPLNPARGDASPRAGVLWGDIRKNVPSGAIIEFADGFESPPHIHNITYRGVVISGAVHNDDPDAERLWLGPGSFWTQPAGEVHITAAAPGAKATIFLEILEGPYLVKPPVEVFDNGERPVNIDATNLIWLSDADTSWIESSSSRRDNAAEIAFLWHTSSSTERYGTLLRLPAEFDGTLKTDNAGLRAVVVRGVVNHPTRDGDDDGSLQTGSYFAGTGELSLACAATDTCLVYVSSRGKFQLNQ